MGAKAAASYIALVFVVVINVPLHSALCNYKTIRPSPSYDGYITSPDYPAPYSSDLCIIWVYYGWPGLQVTIRFLDVDIPNWYPVNCFNDVLRIGPLNEHRYCGSIDNESFEPYTAEFTSSYDWLYIVFNSTIVRTKGRGFKIYYQFSDANGLPSMTTTTMATTTTTMATTTTTMATTTSPFWYSNEGRKPDGSSCQFIINSKTGYIKTDTAVLDCLMTTGKATWQIFYPSVGNTYFKCKIIFDECKVPYPDKLTIYDGYSNEGSVLGEYTEGLCPNFLISTFGSLFLEYTREDTVTLPSLELLFMKIEADVSDKTHDYTTRKTNYQASTEAPSYQHIPSENPVYHYSQECVFHLSGSSGEISSGDIASLVQKSGFCTWLLHFGATDGQIVTYTLNFERFHLSAESTFVVYDGADMTAPVLSSNFQTAPSLSLVSSESSVFVYFNPGINVNFVGVSDVFTVKYRANLQCAEGYLTCGYGELSCYRNSQRCDNIWHCPLHGGDEIGCFFGCPQEFSCGYTTSICYSENERCNGKAFCPNNMDELNCIEAQCSADKGLFLCRSGHCIYESLRCDHLSDCMDHSDEDNCSAFMSTRIIVAAAASSLLCALLVVMSMGCVCKMYRRRVRRLHESQHFETPLTQHLSEMLHHRAPPPAYHEAMLTSRPYSEANLELLDHSEQQEGLLNTGYHDDISLPSSLEQSQRSHPQDNEHSHSDQTLTENQHQASESQTAPGTLIEVGTLALFSENLEHDISYWGSVDHDLQRDDSELPPYSETDPSGNTGSYPSILRDEGYHYDSWQRDFGSGVFTADSSHPRSTRELLIQMEMMPSDGAQHSASAQTEPSVGRNSNGMTLVPERHHMELTNDGSSDMETISTSTIDSTSDKDTKDTENDEIREAVHEDSDSECILFEDNPSEDNSESDSCILAHE